MTKVKLKDATKDLLKGAADMLTSVSSMRKNADDLAQAAKKLEAKYNSVSTNLYCKQARNR